MRRPLWIRLKVFLSTLSLRRATGIIGVFQAVEVNFYPRSPCGERPGAERLPPPRWYFYPRSPCGERLEYDPDDNIFVDFYPRSPCGERRHEYAAGVQTIQFLSTLSLRRATVHLLPRAGGVAISIHALLAESDQAVAVTGGQTAKFLSTLSLRRATWKPALLLLQVLYFYPRSPCGERRGLPVHNKRVQQFLSTLSLRRATRPAAF